MSHSTRATGRSPRARTPIARTAFPIIATAGLALLLAACAASSSPSGSAANARGSTRFLQFTLARCIRSHGVPNFPDPNSSEQIPKMGPKKLGVTGSQLEAAQRACHWNA